MLTAATLFQIPGQPGPPPSRQEAKFKLKAVWTPSGDWGLAGSELDTWFQIGRVNDLPSSANNNPWYLQYFGYPPDEPVPAGFQQTQDATAALQYSQPEGVEWLWMSVAGAWSETLAGWPPGWSDPSAIDLQATEAFEGSEVRCEFYADVELLDGFQSGSTADTYLAGTFSNTGEDDTEQSFYEVLSSNPYPSNLKMVSKITAAEPGALTRIENFPYDPSANPAVRCGRKVRCNLKDTSGRNMPGVLCQERFPEPGKMPPGVATNTENDAWFTRTLAGVGLPNGDWNRYDELRYVWPPPPDPPLPPYPSYEFRQQYWVATKSLAQGGILKSAWKIKLTPGQPGTCEQDEN